LSGNTGGGVSMQSEDLCSDGFTVFHLLSMMENTTPSRTVPSRHRSWLRRTPSCLRPSRATAARRVVVPVGSQFHRDAAQGFEAVDELEQPGGRSTKWERSTGVCEETVQVGHTPT
jgi:hypothetical protein